MRVFYCLFLGLLLVACSTTQPAPLTAQAVDPLLWEPEPYFNDFFDDDAAPYDLPNSPNTPIEMIAVYNPGWNIIGNTDTAKTVLEDMLRDAASPLDPNTGLPKTPIKGLKLEGVYSAEYVGRESAKSVCGKIIAHYSIEPDPTLKNQQPVDFEALYTEARDRLINAGAFLTGGGSQYGIVPSAPKPDKGANSSTGLGSSNRLSSSWAYSMIRTTSPSPYNASGVSVAVIDTGVDRKGLTPGFAATFINLHTGKSEQFVTPGAPDVSGVGHGTGVASLIADAGIGIAPGATIMPLKTCNDMSCDSVAVLRAMCYAAANGAAVINMSLGTPLKSPILEQILKEVTAAGSLVVAGAGNTNTRTVLKNVPLFPAAFSYIPGVISVGAIDANRDYADFSTYPDFATFKLKNHQIEMVAPGSDTLLEEENIRQGRLIGQNSLVDPSGVHTYRADGQLEPFEGTSFAAPLVSGAAAAVIDRCIALGHPVDPASLEKHLIQTGAGWSSYTNQANEKINLSASLLNVGRSLAYCP